MGGYWLSGELKEPDMLLECEVANSTWRKVYILQDNHLKSFWSNSERSNLIPFKFGALKIFVYN
jgi:hypothetical protein